MNPGDYSIEQHPKVVSDDLTGFERMTKKRILHDVVTKLGYDPYVFGKPLRQSLKSCRTLRVGDYRVIYKVSGSRVRILSVRHRSKGYARIEDRINQ